MRTTYFPGIAILLLILTGIFTAGCYTDTIDSLGTFTFQLPVQMEFQWRDKLAPDTTTDRVDLLEYQSYRDNREDITEARIHQIGYWVDTLVGNPGIDQAEFEFVEFFLRFEGDSKEYLLGRYEDVVVQDYYKRPHIIPVPDSIGTVIARAVKENPAFDVIQRYSTPKSGSGKFSVIDGRVDLIIRLAVDV